MPFSIHVEGMDELISGIDRLRNDAPHIAAWGLYEGAGVVADAVSREMQGISTAPFKYAKGGRKRLPSPEEKAVLMSAPHGVAKFGFDGNKVHTSVGFNGAGYANVSWNHMSSSARTNYKAVSFKGKENTASSTLRFIRRSGKAEQFGLSSKIGHGAQNQKPIGVIANAINHGTSFMKAQPFLRKAFSKSRGPASAAIDQGIKAKLKEYDLIA